MPDTAPNAIAIVNPTAGGGKASKYWPEIDVILKSVYGNIGVYHTSGMRDAEHLSRTATEQGTQEIIAVGGDGTLSEVINGVLSAQTSHNRPVVTPIPAGTGGDFRKTLGLSDDRTLIAQQLRNGLPKPIDLGRITYTEPAGNTATRHFANIASFGLSGEVDKAVNNATWPKRLGGRFTYAWCTLQAMNAYQPMKARLLIDDTLDALVAFNTVAICNGQFFGGGMHVSPHAQVSDGLFDIVSIEPESTLSGIRNASKLYKGTHLDQPNVNHWRGKVVKAIPADESQKAWLDIDGEPLGTLPATFEILPHALKVRH